jgi:hypothetical protein
MIPCPGDLVITIAFEVRRRLLLTGGSPDKHIDPMQTPTINERSYGLSAGIIQATSLERKAFSPKVRHGRRERDLAVKPWFDRVLVRRDDIQTTPQQRSLVR